jgi:hypothetical protein
MHRPNPEPSALADPNLLGDMDLPEPDEPHWSGLAELFDRPY